MNGNKTLEPRWPATLAALAAVGLYWVLPESLTPGPSWVVGVMALAVLCVAIAAHVLGRQTLNHTLGLILLIVLTLAVMWSLGTLIASLPSKREPPVELLRSAVVLWVSNVLVFACWYWRLDAGGPNIRDHSERHREGSFLFPQMTLAHPTPAQAAWRPQFVDYLFLAFNTSTAFSPTDVPVLSRWAKLLMITQSLISLGTLAILAARAINIL